MTIYTQREFERLSDDHQLHAIVTAIDPAFPMKVWAFDGMTKDQQLYQLYKALLGLAAPEIPDIPPALGLINVLHVADFTTEVFNPLSDTNSERGVALENAFASALIGDLVTIGPGKFEPSTQLTINGFTVRGEGNATEIQRDEDMSILLMFGGFLSNIQLRWGGIDINAGVNYLDNVRIRGTPSDMAPLAYTAGNFELNNCRITGHSSQPCISSASNINVPCFASYASKEPDVTVTITPPGGLTVDSSV